MCFVVVVVVFVFIVKALTDMLAAGGCRLPFSISRCPLSHQRLSLLIAGAPVKSISRKRCLAIVSACAPSLHLFRWLTVCFAFQPISVELLPFTYKEGRGEERRRGGTLSDAQNHMRMDFKIH